MSALQIIGLVDGTPTPYDDQYVVEYDPERDSADAWGRVLRCRLVTSPDRAAAREFDSAADALECWRQVCKRQPRRRDGKPNRPLTAFTAAVVP